MISGFSNLMPPYRSVVFLPLSVAFGLLVFCENAFCQQAKPGQKAAQTTDVGILLEKAILKEQQPVQEFRDYVEPKIPRIPEFKHLADWQRYAEETRKQVLEQIVFRGALAKQWRDAKTRVEWLDTLPGKGYKVRKLRYEALPGMWIPALLYLPDNMGEKLPVHLAVNGHDPVGKAAPYKQIRCINLAKSGIASLNIEWLGMGQLRGDGNSHARMNQLDLCGESGLAPFYLSMSRGIDILLSLPKADAGRVAVSGLSGGGWQTIIISSLDPRVTLCNPVAGYSSFRTRANHPSDLGDSEQTPNDLATVADYTHLTALMAGRAALLTYNASDNCCFASGHALQPLLDAAGPLFKLHNQADRLRSHINYNPGNHNFEVDNRQAFYRMVGDIFYPGDKGFDAREIPCEKEVKQKTDLDVPLPDANLDLHSLAMSACKNLPQSSTVSREKLGQMVRYKKLNAVASREGEQTRSGIKATFWKVRLGDQWSVPVTELTAGETKGTTFVIADGGRKSAAVEIEKLLTSGQRVLAVDLFGMGEAQIERRNYLYLLLMAAVGDRPIGLQAGQLAALSGWARHQFKDLGVIKTLGPRTSTVALISAAMEPSVMAPIQSTSQLSSLAEIIHNNWTVSEYPEMFCFGLLQAFDIPQLKSLAGKP